MAGKSFANDISPSLQGALQLIDAMCNTVLEGSVSMPRSIFSVCQSLSDHPGPISAMDFLFDTMLCRELEVEAKSKLSNSVGSDANKKIGRLFLDICVHIRTIISKTKWKTKSLKYKATISNAQAALNAFVQRVVQLPPPPTPTPTPTPTWTPTWAFFGFEIGVVVTFARGGDIL